MSTPTRRFVLTALIALSTLGLPGAAKADVAEDPPSATITSPQDGDMFSGAPITLDVTLDVFEGTMGLDRIELRIDDATVGMLTQAPWTYPGVTLDEGMHTLVAVAIIPGGDEFPSPVINVAVFAGDTTDTGSGTGTDTSADTGTAADSNDESGSGSGGSSNKCSVVSGSTGGGLLVAGLALFGLAGVRRRR